MADTDSDLGTRVHSKNDGIDGHVRIKIVGDPAGVGTTATDHVAVDADKNAHVEAHGNDPTGTDRVLRTSELGSASVDGMYHAVNNTDPSQTGLVGMVRNAANGNLDSDQNLRITAKVGTVASGDPTKPQTDNTRSLDVALHDEAGNAYTRANPLPVSMEESEGAEVHDQNTAAALAAEASGNHDYSVLAGTSFVLHQVICDAIGDARYELQIGDGAVVEAFTKKAVRYTSNSKGGDINLAKGLTVTAVATPRTVRVIRKNKDNKIQDVHTTIVGVTVAP